MPLIQRAGAAPTAAVEAAWPLMQLVFVAAWVCAASVAVSASAPAGLAACRGLALAVMAMRCWAGTRVGGHVVLGWLLY